MNQTNAHQRYSERQCGNMQQQNLQVDICHNFTDIKQALTFKSPIKTIGTLLDNRHNNYAQF